MRVHEGVLIEDSDQSESLLHPCQAMAHDCKFNLIPIGHSDANHTSGDPKMIVDENEINFQFDGRKLFQTTRKPTLEELDSLPIVEVIAHVPHEPTKSTFETHRKMVSKALIKVKIEEWRKILAMAPKEVVLKTLAAITQLAINAESDNRSASRRHFKSRFPFFKYPRLWYEFHMDAFCPDVKTAQNHACAQIRMGKDTGNRKVRPLKKESRALTSLQGFVRHTGTLPVLKRENYRTQTGYTWMEFERQLCMSGLMTEQHSPWQNVAKHSTNDLGSMVQHYVK